MNIAAADINPIALAGANTDQSLVRDALGIALDEARQLYVNGTRMWDGGIQRAQELRREFEDEPMVNDAMDALVQVIKDEERLDYDNVALSGLRIDDSGMLTGVAPGLKVYVTPRAWSHFVQVRPEEVPQGLANNLNAWLGKSAKAMKIRTRNPRGTTRAAYAVVSKKYGVCDLDQIAEMVKAVMPTDSHATWVYGARNGDAAGEIVVSLAPTYQVEELGVGRTMRVSVVVRAADDKSGGLEIVYRVVCIACKNCTTVMDKKLVFHRRHTGDIRELFSKAIGHAGEAMEKFSAAWRAACETSIVDQATQGALDVGECFRRLIAHGYVKAQGMSKTELLTALTDAYIAEPLPGAAGINAAITRMAHEAARSWASPWVTSELEDQAGSLLFNQVFELPALTEEQTALFAA